MRGEVGEDEGGHELLTDVGALDFGDGNGEVACSYDDSAGLS